MRLVTTLLIGSCVLTLTACGGDSQGKTTDVRPGPVPASVAQSTPPATATAAPIQGRGPAVEAYVAAFAAGDPDVKRAGLNSAAPGSVAYVYLTHLANDADAQLDGGAVIPPLQVSRVADSSFKVCARPADETTCATLTDFKTDPAGLVADLTVNGQQLGPRLTAGNGQPVTTHGVTFTFLTAYKAVQNNALLVTLKVETGDEPIRNDLYAATYRDPTGRQRQATTVHGMTELAARSNTIVTVIFQGSNPGGQVTLPFATKAGREQLSAVLNVG